MIKGRSVLHILSPIMRVLSTLNICPAALPCHFYQFLAFVAPVYVPPQRVWWERGPDDEKCKVTLLPKIKREQMRNHRRQLKRALPAWFLLLCVLGIAFLPLAGQEQSAAKKRPEKRGMWTPLKSLHLTFENKRLHVLTWMMSVIAILRQFGE